MPLHLDAYIRVSKLAGREVESDKFITTKIQRNNIKSWAKANNATITWHEDETDKSGGTMNRPIFDQIMERVRKGETGGVIVAKLDRFSRTLVGALSALKEFEEHDAVLVSVADNIDLSTAMGKAFLRILLVFAELERDRIIESWMTIKTDAIERGAIIGPTPYGYTREKNGTITPHPEQAPHIIEAYHLAAARGVNAAHDYLSKNTEARKARYWTVANTRRMLARHIYHGETRNGELVNPKGCEPLVSRAIWEAAQHTPERRRARKSYPLTRLAVCGSCGAAMVGGQGAGSNGQTPKRTYRCSATLTYHTGVKCTKGAHVVADRLEDHIRATLEPLLAGIGVEAREANPDALTLAERLLVEAEAELNAFASDLTARRTLKNAYHGHLESRANAVDEAQSKYRELAKEQGVKDTLNAVDVLNEKDPETWGALLRGILASIVVAPGRGTLDSRVRIIPIGNRDMAERPARAAQA